MPVTPNNGKASHADQSKQSIDRYNAETERVKVLCDVIGTGDVLYRSEDPATKAVGKGMVALGLKNLLEILPDRAKGGES